MEGNKTIDILMTPVLSAIKRHVTNQDAITDIYNRAYEALMEGCDMASDNINASEKLVRLTDAIDTFLNDARGKQAVDCLEQAMRDYGKRK
jgi:ethanolamine utilization protein EutP (predicted NTPase)